MSLRPESFDEQGAEWFVDLMSGQALAAGIGVIDPWLALFFPGTIFPFLGDCAISASG